MTFKEAVHFGTAKLEDIDQWIEDWHLSWINDQELFEWLGMTQHEYSRFVESPANLKEIIYGNQGL